MGLFSPSPLPLLVAVVDAYFPRGEPCVRPSVGPSPAAPRVWADDAQVLVTIALPGVDPATLELSVLDRALRLVAPRRPAAPRGGEEEVLLAERGTGEVAHSVILPFSVDADRAEAVVRDGELHVRLPRAAPCRPRRVAISAAA